MPPMPQPAASIIVPAYKEAGNLRPLIERIFRATREAGIEAETIVVDDNSQDGTEELIAALKEKYSSVPQPKGRGTPTQETSQPVRLIVRGHERGLSSAVLAGFREAKYDQFVVLDADLQHPPEAIPRLLEKLNAGGCDFAIATRYAGGSIDSSWPMGRRLASKFATMLAAPLAPLSDPMSGFFAIRRETFERATNLNPIGYKIALELFVKCGCRHPAEVPIEFGTRLAGESKANMRQGMKYLLHLATLYWHRMRRAFQWKVDS